MMPSVPLEYAVRWGRALAFRTEPCLARHMHFSTLTLVQL